MTEPAIRSAIHVLQLPSGSRGLDAGCGIGTHTLWLAETISPDGHVTGIDISPECPAHTEETASGSRLAEQVSFQYRDMNDLLFDDGTLGWAWNTDTLWPVAAKDPLPLVKELARVVRPGGIIRLLREALTTVAYQNDPVDVGLRFMDAPSAQEAQTLLKEREAALKQGLQMLAQKKARFVESHRGAPYVEGGCHA